MCEQTRSTTATPCNSRAMITSGPALSRPHQDQRSAKRSRPTAYPNYRLARRELRRRRLDYDALGKARFNDALSIYLGDGTLANAFAARWCIGARAEATGGVFQVREGEPVSRLGPTMHRRS